MTLIENRLRGAASLQTVRPGGQLQVRFYVNPLPAVASSLVLPFVAFAPGALHAIPGFAGSLLLPPQGAAVLGALVVTGLQPGFTNVVDERILP